MASSRINPFSWSLYIRAKQPHVLKLLNISDSDSALDVGCGLGIFTRLMSSAGIKKLVGIDIDHMSLSYCYQHEPGVYGQASAEAIPFPDNCFSKLICLDVLEHVSNDDRAVREMVRVCQDGATMVFAVPASEGPLLRTGLKKRVGHSEEQTAQYHVREAYTAPELADLMRRNEVEPTEYVYALGMLGEVLVIASKLVVALKTGHYRSQADALTIQNSWLFDLYTHFLFPLLARLTALEDKTLGKFIPGHILIMKGIVWKA